MTTPNLNQFCWNELATTNISKAKEFYEKVFGWQFKDISSPEMTYTMAISEDKEMSGMWQIPAEMQGKIPPHWLAYVLVDNVETALKKAEQNGATIIKETTQAGDFGRLGIIMDPTGACLGLWEPAAKK